jgi:hypothetical protein
VPELQLEQESTEQTNLPQRRGEHRVRKLDQASWWFLLKIFQDSFVYSKSLRTLSLCGKLFSQRSLLHLCGLGFGRSLGRKGAEGHRSAQSLLLQLLNSSQQLHFCSAVPREVSA